MTFEIDLKRVGVYLVWRDGGNYRRNKEVGHTNNLCRTRPSALGEVRREGQEETRRYSQNHTKKSLPSHIEEMDFTQLELLYLNIYGEPLYLNTLK